MRYELPSLEAALAMVLVGCVCLVAAACASRSSNGAPVSSTPGARETVQTRAGTTTSTPSAIAALKLPPFDPACLTESEYNTEHPDSALTNCKQSQTLLDQVVRDPSKYNAVLIQPASCSAPDPTGLLACTFVVKDGTRINARTYVPLAIEFMPLSCTRAQPPSCTYHLEGYAGHPADRTVTMGQASYLEVVDGVVY